MSKSRHDKARWALASRSGLSEVMALLERVRVLRGDTKGWERAARLTQQLAAIFNAGETLSVGKGEDMGGGGYQEMSTVSTASCRI